jgi:3-hydroxymyristoyl/3-hydroxydecanoyl-(acyl carrier protein) dehydratase
MSADPVQLAEFETSPEILAITQSEGRVELNLLIPEELLYFRGHFPEFALLPGVIQLDWAIKFATQYFALGSVFATTIRIKFNKPIRPNSRLTLRLGYAPSRSSIEFEYADADGGFSSGRIGFASA